MIAIIAEKPSVGRDIARVVGATQKEEGYLSGNGYTVTWALGHLVALAMPSEYGYEHTSPSDLPIIPESYKLTVRQTKTDKGMKPDPGAEKQMKIIKKVFDECASIVVATDAGREGELIFRWIYNYLGCKKPFQRLWISSLTDQAIQEGMASLKDGREYDRLYMAADCRAKADWLVGINASRALAAASGITNNSIGRVQTPTLAMICARYRQNKNFIPSDQWKLHFNLCKGEQFRQFRYVETMTDKQLAEDTFARIKACTEAKIQKAERKRTFQEAPLLYDLTTLQKDCNVHYNLSAEKTLETAQSLYEAKLISYPRTGSRYIPDDVLAGIPALLKTVAAMEEFSAYGQNFNPDKPSRHSVNAAKVTDHHALIITGMEPADLNETERQIYLMIAGRMLEAFSPRCEKEVLTMEAVAGDLLFRSRSQKIVVPGWRAVYDRAEDKDEDEQKDGDGTAEFEEGEPAPVSGCSLAQSKTTPKPLYTEATLLTAMETAGKDIPDEKAREAIKELGIGTPATRAAIITTLFKRDYITRSGKTLIPTDKGLSIYDAVQNMRVSDPELTGSWEKTLADIEKGDFLPETFMQTIGIYTRQVTNEVLSIKFPDPVAGSIVCPKCKEGRIMFRHKFAKCNNEDCGLIVFRQFLNKSLTDKNLQQLFSSGKTNLIKGFEGKQKKLFDAMLTFDAKYNLTFSFPPKKPQGKPKK